MIYDYVLFGHTHESYAQLLDVRDGKEKYHKEKKEMIESTDTLVYIRGYAVSWYSVVASALSLQLVTSRMSGG